MTSSHERAEWQTVWLNVARAVSERSSCCRSQVGAVLVFRNEETFVGYNGPASGLLNCSDGGCPRGLKTFDELPSAAPFTGLAGMCTAIHAEINALLKFQHRYQGWHADTLRLILEDCVLYSTREPCEMCWYDIRKWLKPEQVIWSD